MESNRSNSSQRVAFVVNPNAGFGKAKTIWLKEIEPYVAKRIEKYAVRYTVAMGHGRQLTKELVEEGIWDVIVSVGGDGTNNEVVRGYIESGALNKGIAMGVIPLGTGGDFVRTLFGGISDTWASVEAICEGHTEYIDAGEITMGSLRDPAVRETNYFINSSGVGVSAYICDIINNRTTFKAFGGKLGFQLAAVYGILTYRSPLFRYRITDGDTVGEWKTERLPLVECMNGEYAGGSMHFTPDAKLNDGKLDILVFQDMSIPSELKILGMVHEAKHVGKPKILIFKATKFEIELVEGEKPVSDIIETDGESPGRLPIVWRCLPNAIKLVMLPPEKREQKIRELRRKQEAEVAAKRLGNMIKCGALVLILGAVYFYLFR